MFLLLLAACAGKDAARAPADTAPADTAPADTAPADTGRPSDTGETSSDTDTAPVETDTDTAPPDTDTAPIDTGDAPDGPTIDGDDATAKLMGVSESERAGEVVAAGGDLTGDGIDDVIVGAEDIGVVYVVPGPRAGGVSLPEVAHVISGGMDAIEYTLAGGEDVDGDGFVDLIVGAPQDYSYDPGVVYLVRGPVTGPVDLAASDVFEGEIYWSSWEGYPYPYSQTGTDVALGDVSGDGLADLLVGDEYHDATGCLYVVEGPATAYTTLAEADARVSALDRWTYAGAYLAAAGDTDGDGIGDVYVGAYGADPAGRLYLLRGPWSDWTDLEAADAIVEGVEDEAWAGGAMDSAGDVDGDGLPDLLLAGDTLDDRRPDSAGGARIFRGPLSGTVAATDYDALLYSEVEDDWAGRGVAGPGDVDGDGLDDVLIGGTFYYSYAETAGAAWLVRGPVSGAVDLRTADLKVAGHRLEWMGASVDGAGDLDSDGLADLLIGGPGDDEAEMDAGAAWIVAGAAVP